VNHGARSGARLRHEWVASPVPCTNSSTGPRPIFCRCQRNPAARTNWLASRFGQSLPSFSQTSLQFIGPWSDSGHLPRNSAKGSGAGALCAHPAAVTRIASESIDALASGSLR